MSFKARCWKLKFESPVTKLLLLSLSDHCNEAGLIRISIKELMNLTLLGKVTVFKHQKILIEKKLIEVTPQYRDDGGRVESLYKLLF